MDRVARLFVEKRKGFDVAAQGMKNDLVNNLGIKEIADLRKFIRYDIEGLEEEELEKAGTTIFSEPNVDMLYNEKLPDLGEYIVISIESLPGQYDQRADSAAQCVQILTNGKRPKVATATIIAMKGDISKEQIRKIKNYLINPIESKEAGSDKPDTLEMEFLEPRRVERVEGFIGWKESEIAKYHSKMNFAMTLEDLRFCGDYFKNKEKRNPTVTELKVIDTYWSDHCRHTTFSTKLKEIEVEQGTIGKVIKDTLDDYHNARKELYGENERPVCLMDIATLGMKLLRKQGKLDDLDISEEINACSIEVPIEVAGQTEKWLIQFKNETHNHPTEIEPFGGAATCLGGAIRDPLSGRAYVYQAMRVSGSGDPRTPIEKTIKGKLPTRKISLGAAEGYSSYGNQIGLATGQVSEIYDDGYVAKHMEVGAVIGAVPKENVVRQTPKPGDSVILVGGDTGRDGCGGATGSSKIHTKESLSLCGAEVQKGNALTERKLNRLFRNKGVSKLIKKCNDFGAGGACVAIGELADGVLIELEKIPKKYNGLDGTELAISESQERLAVVLDPKDAEKFIRKAWEENINAVEVAKITEEKRLKMIWKGESIVDLSREFLDTNGVTQTARAKIKEPKMIENYRNRVPEELAGKTLDEAFKQNLKRLGVCSQKGLVERFDSSVGAGTVLMPYGGKYQLTPEEAMVAKLPLLEGYTDDATAMAYGFMPGVSKFSPFHGAVYSVVESCSKLAAVGANPLKARLTFQEYFEKVRNEPERWGKTVASLLGALHAQLGLGIPAIGGKDSMSGSFENLDVPPTLISFAVAMTKASKTISAAFKNINSTVVEVMIPEDKAKGLPEWNKLKDLYKQVYQWNLDKRISAASVVKEGGMGAAVAKMCFGNKIGFGFTNSNLTFLDYFAPMVGNLVIEFRGKVPVELNNLEHRILGETIEFPNIRFPGKAG